MRETTERRALVMPRFLAERQDAPVEAPARERVAPLRGLRREREARGLTIAELSVRTGLTTTMLGLLESLEHPPTPRTWHTIARALELDPDELLWASAPTTPRWLVSTPR